MSWAKVQSIKAAAFNTSTLNASLPSAVSAGSLLVAGASQEFGALSDNRSNTWNRINGASHGGTPDANFSAHYAQNVAAGSTTVTNNGTTGNKQLIVAEYSGIHTTAALRTHSMRNQTGLASTWSSLSITPVSGDLLIGYVGTSGKFTLTPDAGWDLVETLENNTTTDQSSEMSQRASDGSSIAYTGTFSASTHYVAFIIAFQPAPTDELQISAAQIESDNQFGAAEVTQGRIEAPGIGSDEAFGSATLVNDEDILAAGIASQEAFGTAKLNQQLLAGAGISSQETFGSTVVQTTGGGTIPVLMNHYRRLRST